MKKEEIKKMLEEAELERARKVRMKNQYEDDIYMLDLALDALRKKLKN